MKSFTKFLEQSESNHNFATHLIEQGLATKLLIKGMLPGYFCPNPRHMGGQEVRKLSELIYRLIRECDIEVVLDRFNCPMFYAPFIESK